MDDTEGLMPMEDDIEKRLNKIPPNWDDAEKHGKSSLVFDLTKSNEVYSPDAENFCHCCQSQIPTDEDLFPLDDNMCLGDLGEGFPILF